MALLDNNLSQAFIFQGEIQRIKTKLRKEKKEIETLKNILDDIDLKHNDLIFNLRESTGNGNYKDLDFWSLPEMQEYINRKNKQYLKAQSNRK